MTLTGLRPSSPYRNVSWSADRISAAECPQQASCDVDCAAISILAAIF